MSFHRLLTGSLAALTIVALAAALVVAQDEEPVPPSEPPVESAPPADVPPDLPPERSPVADPLLVPVQVLDNYFEPAAVTAAVGQTVQWAVLGIEPHTVTSADGTFDSGILSTGQLFSVAFGGPGEYRYVCRIHPGMEGTLSVVGEAPPALPPTPAVAEPPASTSIPTPAPTVAPTLTVTAEALPTVTLAPLPTATEPEVGATALPVPSATPVRPPTTQPTSFVPPPTVVPPSPTRAAQPTSSLPSSATVDMLDFSFRPSEVRVRVGASVTWSNRGQAPHTATAVNSSFDTQTLNPGQSRTLTMTTAGRIEYVCSLHRNMNGVVIVQ